MFCDVIEVGCRSFPWRCTFRSILVMITFLTFFVGIMINRYMTCVHCNYPTGIVHIYSLDRRFIFQCKNLLFDLSFARFFFFINFLVTVSCVLRVSSFIFDPYTTEGPIQRCVVKTSKGHCSVPIENLPKNRCCSKFYSMNYWVFMTNSRNF